MSTPARVLCLLAMAALAGCGQDLMYKNKDYAAMNPIAMNSTLFRPFRGIDST